MVGVDPPDAVVRRLLEVAPRAARQSRASPHDGPSRGPSSLAGIEQEYAVWIGDRQVDFADLIERVVPSEAVAGFVFDDAARIVRSGAIWTVDAPHAEVATAPRALRRGVACALADDALRERDALRRRVAAVADGRLHGYSTHLNAFADAVDGWDLAEWFAARYAPAVMLLTEREGSPGLLVRPRPQRLEIGSEFLEDRADIVAASVLVLAGVIAAWRAVALGGRGFDSAVVPLDASLLRETWQRPGLFIAPAAITRDPRDPGHLERATVLRRPDGRLERADDRLRATWAELRPIASAFATSDELRLLDGVVTGVRPVPSDRGLPCEPSIEAGRRPRVWAPGGVVRAMAWIDRGDRVAAGSSILRPARRGVMSRSPAAVTWALTVLRIEHPDRTFFIRVPRERTRRFERRWADGSLDAVLAAFAASPATGSVARLDEASPGLFDTVEPPGLAAARMEPAKGRAGGPVLPGGKGRKRRVVPPPIPRSRDLPPVLFPPPPRERPWLIPILAIGIVVTIVVLILRIPQIPTTVTGGSPTPPGSMAIRSVGPSDRGCPVGAVCPSQRPAPSPSHPSGSSPCPIGAVCASPPTSDTPPSASVPAVPSASASAVPSVRATARASPRSTPRPTPKPTPRPTPRPDRTDPSITRLAWTPPVIGAPLQAGSGCDPATGLGTTDVVTVRVTDPSGVAKVTLRYRLPSGTFTRPMTKSGGLYRTTLDAASDPARWRPPAGQSDYDARLSVRAEDGAGNVRTTAFVTAFRVAVC